MSLGEELLDIPQFLFRNKFAYVALHAGVRVRETEDDSFATFDNESADQTPRR